MPESIVEGRIYLIPKGTREMQKIQNGRHITILLLGFLSTYLLCKWAFNDQNLYFLNIV